MAKVLHLSGLTEYIGTKLEIVSLSCQLFNGWHHNTSTFTLVSNGMQLLKTTDALLNRTWSSFSLLE